MVTATVPVMPGSATRALWAALTAQPGATAAELAVIAGTCRWTGSRALVAFEAAGLARRIAGVRDGVRPMPDRWHPTPVGTRVEPAPQRTERAVPTDNPAGTVDGAGLGRQEPVPAARLVPPGSGDTSPDGEVVGTAVAGGTQGRLGAGQLRAMVLRHMREHADQDFTPSALGDLLSRSPGAVANSCARLHAEGEIVRTCNKPRRYRFGSTS
jgi:hypothetical protein